MLYFEFEIGLSLTFHCNKIRLLNWLKFDSYCTSRPRYRAERWNLSQFFTTGAKKFASQSRFLRFAESWSLFNLGGGGCRVAMFCGKLCWLATGRSVHLVTKKHWSNVEKSCFLDIMTGKNRNIYTSCTDFRSMNLI